jgi:hypothetical protein
VRAQEGRRRPGAALLIAGALAGLLAPAAGGSQAPARVPADWFSCHDGKYAFVLSNHYPTLFKIGHHRVTELQSVLVGDTRLTTRRVSYIGMRLDVRVSSANPDRFQLLEAEVWSRRWNVGRLSVGQVPWRWGREKSLAQTPLEGEVELVGSTGSVLLGLRDGRLLKARFRCSVPSGG